ncbi:hypothetical protein DS901_11805 [Loktanella sp. D2R18]|uniref:outer membrane protein n=1 Tax=Rhodobacterales TaxID=204455 RepID=UPI000DEA3E9C|nr:MULTISPECIES: outer membrane beta-barrel protein [Rhodobacterales]MDO6590269.1 outer membrane beta-barrel protein [Yoonia sp. 1_MG-2023]RBW42922.1 hypothetical protein DS901_11805 [Loktanella sp. D2R18]
MKIFIPVLLASSLVAQSAFAGGLSDPIIPVAPPAPPVVVPLDWYAGVQAGNLSGDLANEFVTTNTPSFDVNGPIYGVHAGVQRAFGGMTLGAEIDYNTSGRDIADDEEFVETELSTLAHLKLRAGANIGNAFVYGTAGLAYADMSITAFGLTTDMADTAPFYGVGADMMVSESISIGAEYLIHSFEDMDDTGYDVEFNTAMVRASYHF